MNRTPTDLYAHFCASLARLDLTPPLGVLVAFSGGPDSTVLAHLFLRWHRDTGARVVLGHYVHVWPPTGAWELAWVRAMAREWGLPLVVGHDPWPPGQAVPRRDRSEAALRRRRMAFLVRAARSLDLAAIALGHHRDDQVETFWYRLLRGSGVPGLVGMRADQPFHGARLVRPLLEVPRTVLRAYARVHGLHAYDDPSNWDLTRDRNWIRLRLLPELAARFPAVRHRTWRLMRLLRDEDWLLRWLTRRSMDRARVRASPPGPEPHGAWDRRAFLRAPRAVQRRWIREAYRLLVPERPLVADQVAAALRFLRRPGRAGSLDLPDGVVLWRERDRFGMQKRPWPPRVAFSVVWQGEGTYVLEGLNTPITFRRRPRHGRGDPREQRRRGVWWLDAERVRPPGRIRARQKGDRFQPLGMAVPVRLKRFFIGRKIPYDKRWLTIVLETDRGIAAVFPWEIADWAKVTSGTRYVWEVTLGNVESSLPGGNHRGPDPGTGPGDRQPLR